MSLPVLFMNEFDELDAINLYQSKQFKGFTIKRLKNSFAVKFSGLTIFKAEWIGDCKNFIDSLLKYQQIREVA